MLLFCEVRVREGKSVDWSFSCVEVLSGGRLSVVGSVVGSVVASVVGSVVGLLVFLVCVVSVSRVGSAVGVGR